MLVRLKRGVVLLGAVVLAMLCCCPAALNLQHDGSCFIGTVNWHGSFHQAEYRISFVNKNGVPLRGVELVVENSTGQLCPCYPVSDFSAKQRPASDNHGVVYFNHIQRAKEIGGCTAIVAGKYRRIAPDFTCRFLVQGREVFRCHFSELNSRAPFAATTATRRWDWREYFSTIGDLNSRTVLSAFTPGDQTAAAVANELEVLEIKREAISATAESAIDNIVCPVVTLDVTAASN